MVLGMGLLAAAAALTKWIVEDGGARSGRSEKGGIFFSNSPNDRSFNEYIIFDDINTSLFLPTLHVLLGHDI